MIQSYMQIRADIFCSGELVVFMLHYLLIPVVRVGLAVLVVVVAAVVLVYSRLYYL